MDSLIIIGCGGHARSVASVLLTNDPNIRITFIDKNARPDETILTFPVQSEMPLATEAVHVAIGDNSSRESWVAGNAVDLVSVVSPRATVSSSAIIGDGAFIAHNSFLGPLTKIGKGNIINTGALVEHEVTIGDFCHVAPNSTVCGRSQIGDNVILGASCTVIDNISICDDVIVGANSTVISDIFKAGTYVGSPARKIK